MWRENRKLQLTNNLKYIRALLHKKNRCSNNTDDLYLKERILDIKLELDTL